MKFVKRRVTMAVLITLILIQLWSSSVWAEDPLIQGFQIAGVAEESLGKGGIGTNLPALLIWGTTVGAGALLYYTAHRRGGRP